MDMRYYRRFLAAPRAARRGQNAKGRSPRGWVVEISGEFDQADLRFFKNFKAAEAFFHQAAYAVLQGTVVNDENGNVFRLGGCILLEVAAGDRAEAVEMIARNEARRLQDSDDPFLGVPATIARLFKLLH